MTKIRKNEKGFSAIEFVLVVLVILIVGVIGWVVYRDHSKTTAKLSDTTANQKTQTYTDPEKAYRVSYPVGWKVVNQSSSGTSTDTPLDSTTAQFTPSTLPKAAQGQTYIAINSFKSNNLMNVFLVETGLIGFASGQNAPKESTINGYQAIQGPPLCISLTSNSETCNSGSAVFYYSGVAHNGVVLVFQFQSQEPAGQSSPAFNASNVVPAFTSLVHSVKFLN